MTAEELIQEVQNEASEWLEVAECPATLVAGILANKVIELRNYIDYLERRKKYDEFIYRNSR